MNKATVFASYCVCFLLLCTMPWAWADSSTNVTLQLKWQHQFQFAGYYVAKELGYYRDVGLEVNIVPASPTDTDTMAKVLSGKAHFGVTHSGIIKQRLEGKPVVALAALLQSSAYCWLVRKDSGIFNPEDFQGQRISLLTKGEDAELMSLLDHRQVDVEVVEHLGKSNLDAWLAQEIDAMQVYVTNEPYQLSQLGIDYRLVCPKRYGLNVYGDVLFTSKHLISHSPEVVERFHQASMRGWRYALLNLDHAIALTQQHYAPNKSLEQLAFEADQLKPLIMQSGNSIGAMSDARWRVITELYHLESDKLAKHFDGFIYQPSPPHSPMNLSWMMVLALVMMMVAVPAYLHLFFCARHSKKA
ncbi:ABC transporter substrate-binding protein [Pseudoalteromonas sp. T1lg10]|uniref:ABC transporter substrate-binding protein n=1 Tax=Pseudoalteromonas sp. T1lg10 TaxID=2077093 RepID=UPI001F35A855|nr:ABC transporter substrate-binding protein [Pseudoalteromonas sp. T1lg10]